VKEAGFSASPRTSILSNPRSAALLEKHTLESSISAEALDAHRTAAEAYAQTDELLRVVQREIEAAGHLRHAEIGEEPEAPPEPGATPPPDPELEKFLGSEREADRRAHERAAEAKALEEQTAREVAEAEERIKAEVVAEIRGETA
jgi:hypothetical protein